MLGRKYIFESKTTKLRRTLISLALASLVLSALLVSFIVYIPIYAKMQKGKASGAFYQKSPDAIAVYTGDKGRISYALDVITKNPSAKLFISGVHAANSFQTLLNVQANPTTGEIVNSNGVQVELDYASKDTFQNAVETYKFLKRNPEIKKVLIISSDYHIMRIKLVLSHFMPEDGPEIYFDSVSSDFHEWSEVRKLLKEAIKIIRSTIQLKILGQDFITED